MVAESIDLHLMAAACFKPPCYRRHADGDFARDDRRIDPSLTQRVLIAMGSNILVPAPNELVPATWCIATGAQTRVARPFFPATPDVGQNHSLNRDQRDTIFGKPLIGCFHRVIKTLVTAFFEKAGRLDFCRNKIFVLQHRILNFRWVGSSSSQPDASARDRSFDYACRLTFGNVHLLRHNILFDASRNKKSNTLIVSNPLSDIGAANVDQWAFNR